MLSQAPHDGPKASGTARLRVGDYLVKLAGHAVIDLVAHEPCGRPENDAEQHEKTNPGQTRVHQRVPKARGSKNPTLRHADSIRCRGWFESTLWRWGCRFCRVAG